MRTSAGQEDKPQSLGDAERRVCECNHPRYMHASMYSGYIEVCASDKRAPHVCNAVARSSASPPPGNNSKSLVINPSPLSPLLVRCLSAMASASSTCPFLRFFSFSPVSLSTVSVAPVSRRAQPRSQVLGHGKN